MKTISCVCLLFVLVLPAIQASCPCHNASLCIPIKNRYHNEIFVFSVRNNPASWKKFDWQKLTTVVSFDYVSTDLMCLAHKHGTRVVTVAGYNSAHLLNSTKRAEFVKQQLAVVQQNYYDGINIDFEEPILQNQSDVRAAFTDLVKETNQAFKRASEFYQVTVDVAWSPNCIDLRCYDYKGLADNSDFLFVMAYSEQSQIFGDRCIALANSDFAKTTQGLLGYLQLGIPTDQLVLGVPWEGVDYPCVSLSQDNVCSIKRVPFRGVNCSDAIGRGLAYSTIYPMLVNQSIGGRHWDEKARSPFFNYKDSKTRQMHQVRYDDPQSLGIKYELASSFRMKGVGAWNIDCLDFSNASYAKQQTRMMFETLPNYPRD